MRRVAVAGLLALAACESGRSGAGDLADLVGSDASVVDAAALDVAAVGDGAASVDLAAVTCAPSADPIGLSTDFRAWLATHGYDDIDFARDDLVGGSFGGRDCAHETITHDPVVFVHGNSDRALGASMALTGFTASRDYFLAHGYRRAELYATTWGDADATLASVQTHDKANVVRTRRFFEAVLAYTGRARIDVIAHSMGVTLARKAILGGVLVDDTATNLGAPLVGSIDGFVGISGANRGLVSCYAAPGLPTCGVTTGLYPGTLVGTAIVGKSMYLTDLASTEMYEGAYRYALYSTADEIVGFGGIVYGEYTSRLPGQTGEAKSTTQSHNETKDQTTATQLSLVRDHTF